MPSFRVTLAVGRLRPGVPPPSLLAEAAKAARALTTVEATDIAVVGGVPRIVVRFTADDVASAARVGEAVAARVAGLAHITTGALTRRVGGRWEQSGRIWAGGPAQ